MTQPRPIPVARIDDLTGSIDEILHREERL
jgi:hypothetical protein